MLIPSPFSAASPRNSSPRLPELASNSVLLALFIRTPAPGFVPAERGVTTGVLHGLPGTRGVKARRLSPLRNVLQDTQRNALKTNPSRVQFLSHRGLTSCS